MRLLGNVTDSKYIGVGEQQLVTVTEAETTKSKAGKPMIEYTLTSAGGSTITAYLSLSDNALWKLKTFVAACGVPADKLNLFDVDNPRHHAALVGKQLYIDVVPPTEGRKYPEISRWYSLAGKTMQSKQEHAQSELVGELESEVPF